MMSGWGKWERDQPGEPPAPDAAAEPPSPEIELSPELVALTASMDQCAAFLGQFGEMLKSYHRRLGELGFSRAEAFALVRDYHQMFMAQVIANGFGGRTDAGSGPADV